MDNTKVEGKMEALSEHGEKERQVTMKTWGDSEINSTKAMEKADMISPGRASYGLAETSRPQKHVSSSFCPHHASQPPADINEKG